MFERTVSPEDLDRLYRERQAADRAYNDALTRLDEAIRPLREPPAPVPATPAEEPPTLTDGGELSLSNPGSPESGWRRWVRGLIATVVGPALERQAAINRMLVEHLAREAAARRNEREAAERQAAFLREELGALATFQSRLVQYVQQLTPYVDTKDREVAGILRRVSEDNTVRAEELALRVDGTGSGLEAVASAQRALDESFALLEASARILKRELHRLRSVSAGVADPAPGVPAAADPATGAPPEAAGPIGAADAEDGAVVGDASAYVGFEDVFRGRHDDIIERQRAYLPYFEGASDVLDLGCGRGEFLELLREQGIAARGIDTNPEMVARCVERRLDVTRSDALTHLRGLPEASVGGLFSAQVVEHVDPQYLIRLLEAMHRVLRPGGRAVIETINPASWNAFFSAYLRDVTHRQPLHPDTLQHLLRAAGFTAVEVAYCSPTPEASRLQRIPVDPALAATPTGAALCELAGAFNRNVDRLNELMFADQDYAAIATRQD